MQVQRAKNDDIERIKELLDSSDENQENFEKLYEATINPDSPNLSFVCRIGDDVIGAFLLTKDVNLDYYKSHFHI